ncbi:lactate racemase domain-containing protein [uncultured Gimesia sp.]|uniref:lactate racemase domain-containing protein n=1 Tax=uncultured Gimesia sp. TaxID=1678688 RepID=UPI0030DA2FBE
MSITETVKIELNYGFTGKFRCEIPSERLICYHQAPAPLENVLQSTEQVLNNPLELPPLDLAVVPGDKLTITVDFQVPAASEIINAVWEFLSDCGIEAGDVTILQTQSGDPELNQKLKDAISKELQEGAQWVIHDPQDQDSLGYLGTSAGGERIYLSKHLLEADFILPIELVSFDPLIGYAGGGSSIYPGFSSQEAVIKSRGQSHRELTPAESRPLRQLIDEVAWILGLQYSLQVIPAGGLQVSEIIFGSLEASFRKAKTLLDQYWKLEPEYKSEMVIIAVECGPAGHQWNQLGRVLETARNLVTQDGRIVLLTQIEADFGEGMQILSSCHEPLDAIKPLRDKQPGDLVAATQMALTGDWALICLLSQASSDDIEDLFIIPLENEAEVQRLLQTDETVSFIASAQHVYGQLKQE